MITLLDLIKAKKVAVGEKVTLTRRDGATSATITADGTVKIGRTDYATPSMAARSITGCEVNGWRAWRLQDGRCLAELRDTNGKKAQPKASAKKKAAAA